jgi:hypothetical protein
MIDRCSNKVAITSQDRLQPMDKWEDYPIKVLDMAPLVMVMLPTVSSFFSTCGCFLWDGRSSSEDPPPLSLACGWPLGVNGSLYCEWRCLHELSVEHPSGARKGGPNRPWDWTRPAGLGRPAQAHPGPVRSPLHSHGFSCIYALCLLHLLHFYEVILASKMEVLRAWSSVFYASILGDVPFVTLRSLPPLEVISSSSWTRTRLRNCSFELVVNPSFMSMFSYINITLPNACTKVNLLYD